jgi:carbon-monoxide dehydrogenase large subunit
MSFLEARTHEAPQGFGKSVRRREDARLVAGEGRFTDDIDLPGQAHAHVVRSPHAHARIVRIDVAGALARPGVIAVLTGGTPNRWASAHSAPSVSVNLTKFRCAAADGSELFIAPHPALATDTVRFVGEGVALVVAETRAAAEDGAEGVTVEYAALSAVAEARDALASDAPLVWNDHGTNVCVDSHAGDAAATEDSRARPVSA